MKKLFKIGLASLLVLAMLSGAALADYMVVNNSYDDVFVRSQPNNQGSVLATMADGQYARYLGETVENGITWYQVSYSNKTGWVSSKYTELVDSDSTGGAPSDESFPTYINGCPVVATVDYSDKDRVIASDGRSFIRNGPGIEGRDVGTLPAGATAAYLGLCYVGPTGREWYRINYNGTIGWVSGAHTTIE